MAAKYECPDDLRYTESDEWLRIDGATARIGITDYAQSELSDIVFVELPEAGARLVSGQAFGVVESVKAVTDLLAPASGRVTEINGGLEENPEWVNEEPYGQGWILAIELEDPQAVDALMTADAYRKYVEERAG